MPQDVGDLVQLDTGRVVRQEGGGRRQVAEQGVRGRARPADAGGPGPEQLQVGLRGRVLQTGQARGHPVGPRHRPVGQRGGQPAAEHRPGGVPADRRRGVEQFEELLGRPGPLQAVADPQGAGDAVGGVGARPVGPGCGGEQFVQAQAAVQRLGVGDVLDQGPVEPPAGAVVPAQGGRQRRDDRERLGVRPVGAGRPEVPEQPEVQRGVRRAQREDAQQGAGGELGPPGRPGHQVVLQEPVVAGEVLLAQQVRRQAEQDVGELCDARVLQPGERLHQAAPELRPLPGGGGQQLLQPGEGTAGDGRAQELPGEFGAAPDELGGRWPQPGGGGPAEQAQRPGGVGLPEPGQPARGDPLAPGRVGEPDRREGLRVPLLAAEHVGLVDLVQQLLGELLVVAAGGGPAERPQLLRVQAVLAVDVADRGGQRGGRRRVRAGQPVGEGGEVARGEGGAAGRRRGRGRAVPVLGGPFAAAQVLAAQDQKVRAEAGPTRASRPVSGCTGSAGARPRTKSSR